MPSDDDDQNLTGATLAAFIGTTSSRKGLEIGSQSGVVVLRPLRYDARGDRVRCGRVMRFDGDQAARLIVALINARNEAAKAG